MKKIILLLSLGMFGFGTAQYQHNDGYGNNGWYDNYQDGFYFPEEYYYDYPTDYYGDNYYQTMYNDYRNSIERVNWNQFFVQGGLSSHQINLVIQLNRQFSSFNVWNSYYRNNPVRWFYDRFYALERILGPRVFIVFQNNFYNGYNPIQYYNKRWTSYYVPRYKVRPMYRNVNVNIYYVNKYDFHKNSVNRFGWNEPKNFYNGNRNNGGNGLREQNYSNAPMQGNRNVGVQNRTTEQAQPQNRVSNSQRVNNENFRNNREGNSSSRVSNQGRVEQRTNSTRTVQPSQQRTENRNSTSGSSRVNSNNRGISR